MKFQWARPPSLSFSTLFRRLKRFPDWLLLILLKTTSRDKSDYLDDRYFENNDVYKSYEAELPLRSELFSADQLEMHAQRLAASHKLIGGRADDQLLNRLTENEALLIDVCKSLAGPIDRHHIPAAEWLLDNFYLIEEQIRIARRHFPKGYSRALPRLANGASARLPRVYDIALEIISHGDGRVDLEILSRFVTSYQTVTPLGLGELWAIPIMLRLALIENLRRVAARLSASRMHRHVATSWADRMLEVADTDPKNLILVIADMARSRPPMVSAFVAELARRLQGHIPGSALPLTWIEQSLSESHSTIEQLVRLEAQQQAADQVSIGNSIGSLRFLSAMDWRDFVESVSLVEQILAQDPTATYTNMSFATRDNYRHAVEKIARNAVSSEDEVARRALQMAQASAQQGDERAAHIGFYLIDCGRSLLERALEVRTSKRVRFALLCKRLVKPIYFGSLVLLSAIFSAALIGIVRAEGYRDWSLAPLALLLVLCASRPAIVLVNWLATLITRSRALPRMDFSEGVPITARTLVAVPTLLSRPDAIDELCEALEVRCLANRDEHVHFVLLTDFLDAPTETCADDAELLQLIEEKIITLNAKYDRTDLFFLLHRPRLWNARDNIWMGYERKRGKLAELNAFLRDGDDRRFMRVVGDTSILKSIKYVITLDTDTQLPRDSAREMIGAIAHPLNRAQLIDDGDDGCRVVAGYAILQPLVAMSVTGANASRYAQLCSPDAGVDPYTRTVADVYQNLFREGSFIGKGIYDVDAFERALAGRIPENRILSHDLLEGCIARSGLLSDCQLYEEYPAQYSADVRRRRRWIRGDWQLLAWLLPHKSPVFSLSMLSRWKIFDNLLRSLNSTALTSLLLFGWLLSPVPGFWTMMVIAMLVVPALCVAGLHLFRKSTDMLLSQHLVAVARGTGNHLAQMLLTLACLPFDAFFTLAAIFRTLARITITRRNLLEWAPSGEVERNRTNNFIETLGSMWIAPCGAMLIAVYLALFTPNVLPVAAPILLLWLLSPLATWWISRPLGIAASHLDAEKLFFLRKNARRTWGFFEEFVVAEDNWLPPDNYQEYREAVIAHRTSPTNIGMALLANVTAHDFGYIPTSLLLERTENTLATMAKLERYQGHFFNWYDTETLQPLLPIYISTVDSGNLAGHLLVLRQALLALIDQPEISPQWLIGVRDTLSIVQDEIDNNESSADIAAIAHLQALLTTIESLPLLTAETALPHFEILAAAAFGFSDAIEIVNSADRSAQEWGETKRRDKKRNPNDVKWWAHAFARQCRAFCDELRWLTSTQAATWAHERSAKIERLAEQVHVLAQMQYDFLYDKTRCLLAIGYNVSERRRDASFYDLLASEARLAVFVAVAQRQVPQESWFALGRLLVGSGGAPVLMSWSGSMFEYLMPLLVMPTYTNTLLDQTNRSAVARQIEYGKLRGVPWGISESGHNTVDAHLTYQYHAFGVPGLGLKRGLAEDLVIAPYASVLALMVAPEAACTNLQRLAAQGMQGRFGFYEAIDFTPSRQRRNETSTIVYSFMAHHQGMSLLALAYLLLGQPMQRRFEADLALQSTLLLLQERIPKATAIRARAAELTDLPPLSSNPEMPVRIFNTANTPNPEVQLLSNGRYHVMVTNSGGGYSRWKDLAVTRWREDSTCDNWGTFCYIRDVASGEFWSTGLQPTSQKGDSYQVIFSEGRVEFRRSDHGLDTHVEIVVSPEDDIELRRTHITNTARTRRLIEVTSYAEVVIASDAADAAHPAFSNLFVQTEIVPQRQAILCSRRPRSHDETTPWMLHLLAVHGADVQKMSYETDRRQFIGRGNTLAQPSAMNVAKLSGSTGSVLDPIVAIRYQLTLEPDQTATIDMVTGMGDTREIALGLIEKYQDRHLADRVFDLAWTHSQVLLRQLNASEADAQLYGRLANSIIYANASLRADASVLIKNRRGQSGLWAYAISGDLPIVLLQIQDSSNIELVRQLIQAHAYWRLKGLAVDLVIWNEDRAGYRQVLQDQILGLIGAGPEAHVIDRPGGIFVRPAEQIANEDRVLLQTVARVIINDSRGTLAEQINRRAMGEVRVPKLEPKAPLGIVADRLLQQELVGESAREKVFDNGLGGFSNDGLEYVITLSPGRATPAPWSNVLANPHFGTVISESGGAYTWYENAHEFRLTPWCNDAVSDSSGEALYIRDEDSGDYWSPTPLPCRGANTYTCRHGFGYSVFEYSEDGIDSELTVFVAADAAVKFSILKLRNTSERHRKLSATGFVEWVLGDLRPKTAQHIVTEIEPNTGALCANNPYSNEYPNGTAFFDAGDIARSFSGDRNEFIGRNGVQRKPAALARQRLSGKVGAGLDSCAAIQVPIELPVGQEREIIFRLGFGGDAASATQLIQKFRGASIVHAELDAVKSYWRHTLGAVQIDTPDIALNLLSNGWLMYQVIASRLRARSGYYQSGGAFGFRDQLQDAMALIHTEPLRLREQLLLCASRQFSEGDVQHWWHPPSGRGVRTHCSDDFLWLPLAACRYVLSTNDTGVLNEALPFLSGRAVNAGDDSYYDLPGRADEVASLYEHCVRAIRYGLRFGEHGLPLIGSGDWNDGMNLVGIDGKGESIWLGFFLCDVLTQFAQVASLQGDSEFAELCIEQSRTLRINIDTHGWDGAWYRRAYFDDGAVLGSAGNDECQIDSISQSWSVLSKAAAANSVDSSADAKRDSGRERSRMAMDAVYQRLVRKDAALIQLLDPPFDKSSLNPGYIKGYVPGVRENGGQYTHAAIWAAMAFAQLGDSERAWELLRMINPVLHGLSAETIATYKVEPYVIAADVYAVAPHVGRGGWSWYTGSAGWMYRLIIESLLGLRLEGNKLWLAPCLPKQWPGFTMQYRFRRTTYRIDVLQMVNPEHGSSNTIRVLLDGIEGKEAVISLIDDEQEHIVAVFLYR
jgi:cellobiose phosphorylase